LQQDQFFDYMIQQAIKLDQKVLLDNRSKFVLVHSSSGFKHSLKGKCMMFFIVVGIWSCSQSIVVTNMLDGVKSFLCHVCLWFIYICLSGFDIFFWHWLCLLLAPQWQILVICTHTHLTALFPGLSRWADTRKVEPIWILLKLETVSASGISWAICKSAPCSRQTTTLAPLCFLHAGCPSCWPTNSVKALKANSWDHSSYMHVSEMSVAVVVSK